MREAITEFLRMPWYWQLGVTIFVLAFLAMIMEPRLKNRAERKRFAALADASRQRLVTGPDESTDSFPMKHDNRTFTVRRELRTRGDRSSYRGPIGHLIVIETPLANERWEMHGVDIAQRGTISRGGMTPFKTGDADFDKRFTAWQDGLPVRESWLDAPTRATFIALFDDASVAGEGTVWVQQGMLQYICDKPSTIDTAALTAIVDRLADMATALEKTARLFG